MTRIRVALAGDHAGFAVKQHLSDWLTGNGYEVQDFGPQSAQRCDFPDHVAPAAQAVADGAVHFAILVDGAGYPSGMLANKYRGVYAAVANDLFSAKLCREHSNANALCIGGQVIGALMAQEIAKTFLTTQFAEAKYGKRVGMVKAIESANFSGEAPAPSKALSFLTVEDIRQAVADGQPLAIDASTKLSPSLRDLIQSN